MLDDSIFNGLCGSIDLSALNVATDLHEDTLIGIYSASNTSPTC
jgi:hypothetical protein